MVWHLWKSVVRGLGFDFERGRRLTGRTREAEDETHGGRSKAGDAVEVAAKRG